MKPVLLYINEVKLEISKVTWPKRHDVVKLTLVVIIITVIVGLYVGGLDFGFTKLLEVVVRK